jgi:hypothetical protein
MNRAFYILLAPAALVAILLLALGYRPRWWGWLSLALFLAAFAWVVVRRPRRP